MRTLFLKLSVYLLAACCLLGLGGLIFIGQGIVTAEFGTGQLAPQPERFTQLYFTQHNQLPGWLQSNMQEVAFTISNVEHQDTNYSFVIKAESGAKKQELYSGSLIVPHGQTKALKQQVTVPNLGERIKIEVALQYQVLQLSGETPVAMRQSIHYWLAAPKVVHGTN